MDKTVHEKKYVYKEDADFSLYKSQIDADFGLYKGMRDGFDAINAKHNQDAFALYKNQRDQFDVLKDEICELKRQIAIDHAVEPYQNRIIMDAIALERERRECADCSIVNYANCTFVPQYIADLTPATTSVQKTTSNPLSCMRGCGCRG